MVKFYPKNPKKAIFMVAAKTIFGWLGQNTRILGGLYIRNFWNRLSDFFFHHH
jgi:hypothetical protein